MNIFQGSMVAIVTPFRDGEIDEARFKALIELQIANGTSAIVPCGTTGESATLSHAEHDRMVKLTVEYVSGRVPIIAGTGSNSTKEAIELTQHAKESGADAALLITPYYNKPTQQGLYEHYLAISEAVDFPLVLYNVPGRTAVNMLPETMARIAERENIHAVKEASGSINQIAEVIRMCGSKITVLSGDDALTLPIMMLGGKGVISVAANIMPAKIAEMIKACLDGRWEDARKIHFHLLPLFNAMFFETNPIPVKTSLAILGRIEEGFRLPLCKMNPGNREKLIGILKGYGLV